jgi:uncharacterized protein YceK
VGETWALAGFVGTFHATSCDRLPATDYLEDFMRSLTVFLMTATLLVLGGCSMLDRSSSSENVRTAYAGPASMSADQVRQLLHNQGYTNVSGLHQNGDDWVGAATDGSGKHVDFDMDKNGVIHTK